MTPQEYIDFERPANEKHDYVDGEAVLRIGAEKFLHSCLQSDILMAFYTGLYAKGPRYGVMNSSMKVYVSETRAFIPT